MKRPNADAVDCPVETKRGDGFTTHEDIISAMSDKCLLTVFSYLDWRTQREMNSVSKRMRFISKQMELKTPPTAIKLADMYRDSDDESSVEYEESDEEDVGKVEDYEDEDEEEEEEEIIVIEDDDSDLSGEYEESDENDDGNLEDDDVEDQNGDEDEKEE